MLTIKVRGILKHSSSKIGSLQLSKINGFQRIQ